MVYFPTRKCYHAAKIALLLILVITLLTLFEQWRGGKRSAGATFSDPVEAEFERQILEDEARVIPGLGEGGVAAHLVGEDKRLGEESEKKLAMNVYLSDRISYNRTLKDFRNPACSRVVYDAELPSASVILIFHNEPYSVVVRTVWSVINSARRSNPWFSKANFVERGTGKTMTLGYPGQDPSSPFVYLKEIILVDDNSTLPELKGKLSYYVRTRLPPDLIRILRLPDRTLGEKINEMKQEPDLDENSLSYHDIHHYSIIYVLVSVVVIAGAVMAWRRGRRGRRTGLDRAAGDQRVIDIGRYHGTSSDSVSESGSVVQCSAINAISKSDRATSPTARAPAFNVRENIV